MATSKWTTTQYTSEEFVDSAGVVLLHIPSKRVCLLYLKAQSEWILPKGRRNCGESRETAAIREVAEETGFPCYLIDVTMTTRAPPTLELGTKTADETRAYRGSKEPFMLTLRQTGEKDIKLIWWYIAAIDEDRYEFHKAPEEMYDVQLCEYQDALGRLTFSQDRDILRRAIEILSETRFKTQHDQTESAAS